MATPRVLVPIDEVVRVTENHGGYLGAQCIICKSGGWLHGKHGFKFNARGLDGNELKHKVSCAMNNHALAIKERNR